jgi:hypothetical protein
MIPDPAATQIQQLVEQLREAHVKELQAQAALWRARANWMFFGLFMWLAGLVSGVGLERLYH